MLKKIKHIIKRIIQAFLTIVISYVLFAFMSGDPWFLLGTFIPNSIYYVQLYIKKQLPVEIPIDIHKKDEIANFIYPVHTEDNYAITIQFAYPKPRTNEEHWLFEDVFHGRKMVENSKEAKLYQELDLKLHVIIYQENIDGDDKILENKYITIIPSRDSFTIRDPYPIGEWIGEFILTRYLKRGLYQIIISNHMVIPDELQTSAKIVIFRDERIKK